MRKNTLSDTIISTSMAANVDAAQYSEYSTGTLLNLVEVSA